MTVENLGFFEVAGKLEPKGIAGEIARDAHNRVAEAVTLTLDWLEEEERPLNQVQKVQFLECVLRCMDGFERTTLETLMGEFAKIHGGDDAR
jgi:hypothetical protein